MNMNMHTPTHRHTNKYINACMHVCKYRMFDKYTDICTQKIYIYIKHHVEFTENYENHVNFIF